MKTEKMFLCTIDEEDGELVTLKMSPVDLCALLELADEMEEDAMYWLNLPCDQFRSHDVLGYVRRVRKALGVEN